jgi:hypothetical protein
MLSLAPLRYRHALDPASGPITRIDSFGLLVLDRKLFHANAFLRPGLGRASKPNTVYGTADGSRANIYSCNYFNMAEKQTR